MAAGDLENIVLTSPDSASQKSKLVRNIIWRDATNVNRSVKEVYWCPDGVTAKLVWQRDHSPTQTEYNDVFNSSKLILFKYKATSSSITSIKLWTNNNPGVTYNWFVKIVDSQGNHVYSNSQINSNNINISEDTLIVNGSSKTVYTVLANSLNINGLTTGNDYYISFNYLYGGNHYPPLVYKDETGNYGDFNGQESQLEQNTDNISFTIYNDHKLKVEVNGAQV